MSNMGYSQCFIWIVKLQIFKEAKCDLEQYMGLYCTVSGFNLRCFLNEHLAIVDHCCG